MYKVVITSRAERELRRLDKSIKNRIVSAIQSLGDEPRIRVGDWRVGYGIDDQAKLVDVIRVSHRSQFYS